MPLVIYGLGMDTHIATQRHAHAYPHKIDLKIPDTSWPECD